jgi:hypothetical protein
MSEVIYGLGIRKSCYWSGIRKLSLSERLLVKRWVGGYMGNLDILWLKSEEFSPMKEWMVDG